VKAGQLGGGRAKLGDTIDVITLQTLARRGDIAELTAGYGLVVAESATTSRPPRSRTLSPNGPPLLAVATGPYAGEGFDCPPPDTLFLAAPVANKGSLRQYAGRILRPYDGKATGTRCQSAPVASGLQFAGSAGVRRNPAHAVSSDRQAA
jgi:superfamily II DNA or RNA helicase